MTREPADVKARRLLAEGRLSVEHRHGDLVIASCRGDSGLVYRVGYDPTRHLWYCDCEARRMCSHITALMLVCVVQMHELAYAR